MASNRDFIAELSRYTGAGDVYARMQSACRGFNYRSSGVQLEPNTDHYGMLFATRPNMNLSYHNCLADRRLHSLLVGNDDPNNLNRMIRCYLDVLENTGNYTSADNYNNSLELISSPLVDPKSPFIPLLSNAALECSGWPDVVADIYTSTQGMFREEISMYDGPNRIRNSFTISITFKRLPGDPITGLFYTWYVYGTGVYQGILNPYPRSINKNRIDYTTRLYRVVLDKTRTIVTDVMAIGAGFPVTNPIGSSRANWSSSKGAFDNSDITIQFQCMGADYRDPITIYEFNRLGWIFNGDMYPSTDAPDSDPVGVVRGTMRKLTVEERNGYMNWKGYPRINPKTMEFEVFAYNSDFKAIGE